jgi:hypothetical protein
MYMRSATAIVTSPSHNQGSNITWSQVIIDPPLPQPPYHPQGGLIGIYIYIYILWSGGPLVGCLFCCSSGSHSYRGHFVSWWHVVQHADLGAEICVGMP